MICGTKGPSWSPLPEHEHRTDEATIRCQAEEIARLRAENERLEAQAKRYEAFVRRIYNLADEARSL